MQSIFFRLLTEEAKDAALLKAVTGICTNVRETSVIFADPQSFRQVTGSPFAYWVDGETLGNFARLPAFGSDDRAVKQGISTTDDFRFVRCWWEVKAEKIAAGGVSPHDFYEQTFKGKDWVYFVKGGISDYLYSDIHLVVYWRDGGRAIYEKAGIPYGSAGAPVRNPHFYFREGLTYSARARRFTTSVVPKGCIFGHTGPMIFLNHGDYLDLCALYSSASIRFFLSLMTLTRKYEVGLISKLPYIPQPKLRDLAARLIKIGMKSASKDELSTKFTSHFQDAELINIAKDIWAEIEATSFKLFKITLEQQPLVWQSIDEFEQLSHPNDDDDEDELAGERLESNRVPSHVAYLLGAIFGRWDIRYATREKLAPDLPDPFAPLPACPPGMLQGADGLPLTQSPPGYPVDIQWDGVLVDDESHPADVVGRVRQVIELLWGERAAAIEREACEILGVKTLRDYFRKSGKGGFWDDHVKRYSKSRRQAPIYWLLQSSKKNYGVWLYYHRLDKDLLYKALVNYVEPKIRLEEARLNELRAQLAAAGNTGAAAKKLAGDVEKQEALLTELDDFRDKLKRAADLNLDPDLNDGVVLNIAPLWELVPWKVAKSYWEELVAGKYEWSTVSGQLRARGQVK